MSEFNFKKFESRNVRLEKRITVTQSNSIGFPQKFYQDNNIKDFKYVVLYFDEAQNAIGLHFTNDEGEQNRFTIIHSEKYGGSILVRSFFRVQGIDPKKFYGRYEWEKHPVEGVGELFVFKLKEHEQKQSSN